MNDLMSRALDLATFRGAQYADVRVAQTTEQALSVKNGLVDALGFTESTGFGVRVLVDGAWGFASSRELSASEVDRVTDLAVKIAKASGLVGGQPADLGPAVT
ncbi:MAG: DNA gyrase modulator, partial [Chloroflexota bacterium]